MWPRRCHLAHEAIYTFDQCGCTSRVSSWNSALSSCATFFYTDLERASAPTNTTTFIRLHAMPCDASSLVSLVETFTTHHSVASKFFSYLITQCHVNLAVKRTKSMDRTCYSMFLGPCRWCRTRSSRALPCASDRCLHTEIFEVSSGLNWY